MKIIEIESEYYPQLVEIYAQGIATGIATFETETPTWEKWDAGHLKTCRIAMMEHDEMLGWAALSPVSSRCVYGGVAEVSIYMAEKARGRGLGKTLLNELIRQSEAQGLWTLQSGIFPQNSASIKLHEQCGFRIIGYRERIGQLHGVWQNNVLMERRSKTVGV
jgi:L-amino acid N-acyltransferase YncA